MVWRSLLFLGLVSRCLGLSLPYIFSDHMVLQAELGASVWGTASAGSTVEVGFGGRHVVARCDGSGRWTAALGRLPASDVPETLVVSGDGEQKRFSDVVVGEVWLCAGQSNMEWALAKELRGVAELQAPAPEGIRIFNPNYPGKLTGGDRFTSGERGRLTPERYFEGQWQRGSPEADASVSAIGYYFAKGLHRERGVPVGIVAIAVGGSPIEAWLAHSALASDPALKEMVQGNWLTNSRLEAWCQERARINLGDADGASLISSKVEGGPNHAFKPGFLWDAGIERIAPFAIRGILWYQGESNSLRRDRVEEYGQLFPLFVSEVRRRWDSPRLPLLCCQLSGIDPASYHSDYWPEFRDLQRRMASELAGVGMVVTSDVGNEHSVHPLDKRTVADRLVGLADARVYRTGGQEGPVPLEARRLGRGISVSFGGAASVLRTSDGQPVREVELVGPDGKVLPATVSLSGDELILSADVPGGGQRVHYGWHPYTRGNLVGPSGLPVSTFDLAIRPEN